MHIECSSGIYSESSEYRTQGGRLGLGRRKAWLGILPSGGHSGQCGSTAQMIREAGEGASLLAGGAQGSFPVCDGLGCKGCWVGSQDTWVLTQLYQTFYLNLDLVLSVLGITRLKRVTKWSYKKCHISCTLGFPG